MIAFFHLGVYNITEIKHAGFLVFETEQKVS